MTSPETMTPSVLYRLSAVQVELSGNPVLGPLDLTLQPGSFVGIVGPNGSGKTTLLRTLTGAVRPVQGEILLNERPLDRYHTLDMARQVGVVPQTFTLDFSFTVEEMVAMGRYARSRPLRGHSGPAHDASPDEDPVAAALRATGLTELAGRPVTQLSGGERQRALIAQTLAQDTPTILLDEPLNNLDLNHQLEIMQLLRALHSRGRTIVVVLHDLNMAAQYCDELLLVDHGLLVARGNPTEVLDECLILEVFKTRVSVHRQGRRPYFTPIWSEPVAPHTCGDRGSVHVLAGGGAAGPIIEELVTRGFAPSVGIVSVFDADCATAQAYGLQVVSAPPFEPCTDEALREFDRLARQADLIVVAPVYFGAGNLAPLRTALQVAKTGTKVLVIDRPPIPDRDMSGGEATRLMAQLVAAGAQAVSDLDRLMEMV